MGHTTMDAKNKFVFGIFVLQLFAAFNSAPAWCQYEIGINRSALSAQSPALQQKTLENIHRIGATWFRDVPGSGSPRGNEASQPAVSCTNSHHCSYRKL